MCNKLIMLATHNLEILLGNCPSLALEKYFDVIPGFEAPVFLILNFGPAS